jgi:hypothetical protein
MSDEKLDLILEKTTGIETALARVETRFETVLWPDGENQPGVLSKHETRMNAIEKDIHILENWRTGLTYAWAAVTSVLGIHWWVGKHGG